MLEDAHALVIGISRYLHAPELRTTQDAQDVAAVLGDPACCGYPPAAVRVLLDGDATRAAILAALDALAHDTREASTVFLYYSGHGATRRRRRQRHATTWSRSTPRSARATTSSAPRSPTPS